MQLAKSRVIFDPEAHTYTLDGVLLRGITGMIESQLFPDKYSGIPDYVMKKAADRGHFVHEVCELVDDLGVSHESEEAKNYQNLKEIYGLNYEASEYLVSDNEHFASCIDKVYRESETDFSLADIKTTYRLDRNMFDGNCRFTHICLKCRIQMQGSKVVRHLAEGKHFRTCRGGTYSGCSGCFSYGSRGQRYAVRQSVCRTLKKRRPSGQIP